MYPASKPRQTTGFHGGETMDTLVTRLPVNTVALPRAAITLLVRKLLE